MKKTLLLFVTLLLTLSVFTVPVKALEPETPVDPDEPEEQVIIQYDQTLTGTVVAGGLTIHPRIEIYGTIIYQGSYITDYSLNSIPKKASVDNLPNDYSVKVTQQSCVFSLNSRYYLNATVNYKIVVTDDNDVSTTYYRSYVYFVAN
ncbi:MAG: hypothetical protein II944_09950 [Ruminobacter sp.]|nr:hypothetical protein [Ruminobacter sp.]